MQEHKREEVIASIGVIDATRRVLSGSGSNLSPSASYMVGSKASNYLTRVSGVIEQVKLFVEAERAEELQYASLTENRIEGVRSSKTVQYTASVGADMDSKAARRRRALASASRVIRETIDVYTDWSSEKLADAEPELRRFEGLPVDFDILSLMQIDGNESIYCRLLGWLLDPKESHGVGDAFLRLFIARLGISSQGRVFNYSRDLEAGVFSEVSWEVPIDEPFQRFEEADEKDPSNPRSRKLRVDILVTIPGYVIPIEVKVYAKESKYSYRSEEWQQAALYGHMWRIMLDAQRDSIRNDLAFRKTSRGWNQSLRECLKIRPEMAERVHHLDGGRAMVVPVLLHPRNRCENQDQPIGNRNGEHNLRVRHMRWLDIDRMLYHLSIERDLQAGRLDLIRSFRTTILRLTSGTDLMERIENLRLRIAEPALTRRFPLESAKTLEIAIGALNHVDVCCRDDDLIGLSQK